MSARTARGTANPCDTRWFVMTCSNFFIIDFSLGADSRRAGSVLVPLRNSKALHSNNSAGGRCQGDVVSFVVSFDVASCGASFWSATRFRAVYLSLPACRQYNCRYPPAREPQP
jgi:hypothetical protein